eukprot:scaffold7359_cov255-Pinguiococcus_pyrenoidosus.AAC.15
MHAGVVVEERDVSVLHLYSVHQLHCGLIDLVENLLLHQSHVAVAHVRLVELRGPGGRAELSIALFPLVPEVLGVRVDVAEPGAGKEGKGQRTIPARRRACVGTSSPDGFVCFRVADHRWLRLRDDAEDGLVLVILLEEAVYVEVDLHLQRGIEQNLGRSLERLPQGSQAIYEGERELGRDESDAPLIQLGEGVLIEGFRHLPRVQHEKLAAHLGRLEAHESGVAVRAVSHHLVVHAHKVLRARLLVHRLVESRQREARSCALLRLVSISVGDAEIARHLHQLSKFRDP